MVKSLKNLLVGLGVSLALFSSTTFAQETRLNTSYRTNTIYNSIEKPNQDIQQKELKRGDLATYARYEKSSSTDTITDISSRFGENDNKLWFAYKNHGVHMSQNMTEDPLHTHIYLAIEEKVPYEMTQRLRTNKGEKIDVVPTDKTKLYEIASTVNRVLEIGKIDDINPISIVRSKIKGEPENAYDELLDKGIVNVSGIPGYGLEVTKEGLEFTLTKIEEKRQQELRKSHNLEGLTLIKVPFYQQQSGLGRGIIPERIFDIDFDTSELKHPIQGKLILYETTFKTKNSTTKIKDIAIPFTLTKEN
jgi:hypothetical protein